MHSKQADSLFTLTATCDHVHFFCDAIDHIDEDAIDDAYDVTSSPSTHSAFLSQVTATTTTTTAAAAAAAAPTRRSAAATTAPPPPEPRAALAADKQDTAAAAASFYKKRLANK